MPFRSPLQHGLSFVLVLAALLATKASGAEWTDISTPLVTRLLNDGKEAAWPGGCSGVVVNRLTGDILIKVVGLGLWRSSDQGKTWHSADDFTITGRDETGWATTIDQRKPSRMASFSLDGWAGWTLDGRAWTRFTSLGRNWDFGSIDWSADHPKTIIAAKHETNPPGEIYATDDGGNTWRQIDIHVNQHRDQISMVGALGETIFIYSKGDGIHRSTDSGATWTRVSSENPQTRIPVLFGGAYYLGTATGLLISGDQGATWQEQGGAVDVWQGPFFGQDEQHMLVVGKQGAFHTRDGGRTWTHQADLKVKENGFEFTPNWFGCYAWDPIHHVLYASAMGNPVFRLELSN